jgi:myo-inositol-1(or 4)-monophosphatase
MTNLASIERNLINIVSKVKQIFFDEKNLSFELEIKEKSYQDYVTNLDIKIQKYLIDSISNIFDGIEIYSEENIKEVEKMKDKCFVIDPLDGTLNFISGIPYFSISVAYVEYGMTRVGVTYDPSNDEMFHAYFGGVFFINDKKLSNNFNNSQIVSISNDFLSMCIEKNPYIIKKLRNYGKIRILGSQALHLAYVSAGRISACINFEAKYWDDVAGYVMLKEVGLDYTNFVGDLVFPKYEIDPKQNFQSLCGEKKIVSEIKKIINDL